MPTHRLEPITQDKVTRNHCKESPTKSSDATGPRVAAQEGLLSPSAIFTRATPSQESPLKRGRLQRWCMSLPTAVPQNNSDKDRGAAIVTSKSKHVASYFSDSTEIPASSSLLFGGGGGVSGIEGCSFLMG